MQSKLNKVVEGGYCVGCGACASIDLDKVKIIENNFGAYVPDIDNKNVDASVDAICPFLSEINEDELSNSLFSDAKYFDEAIGKYESIYAGYVKEGLYRENASSGGITNWLLVELMNLGMIDGVIHVGASSKVGNLFEYKISSTVEEIQSNSKSRYYPVHYDEVLKKIAGNNKKYAFVGVPCFVKSIRLLVKNVPEKYSNIKYCFAIFCGHLKSKSFAEMIALQQGVLPNQLAKIDFRVKNKQLKASEYSVLIQRLESDGSITELPPVRTNKLYGLDWGVGLFKLKSCDWCDDIAGETADIVCGDAWLKEYNNDGLGTNVIVVRNKNLAAILNRAFSDGRIELKEETPERIYQSQAGNYRHRQEGLSMRISDADMLGVWHPKKRISANQYNLTETRKALYRQREKILLSSHECFLKAKSRGHSWAYFVTQMFLVECRYMRLNNNFIRPFIKRILYLLRIYIR